MPGNSVAVHEIRWNEVFPGLLLFRAVRLAAEIPKVLVATVGLAATWGGWWLIAQLFRALPAGSDASSFDAWARELSGGVSPVDPSAGPVARMVALPWALVRPTLGIFDSSTDLTALGFLALCTIWAAAVWAFSGGTITRIAAVQLGRGERIGLKPAARFAARKWAAYFAAPLMPLAMVALLALAMSPVGLLLRWEGAGGWIAAILWPLVLLAGLFLAILVVGLLFGWPLMSPAVSAENGDAFTALSNSYAYVYQRPWHYLGYGALALALGAIGCAAFQLLVALFLYLVHWAVGWSSGIPAPEWDSLVRQLSPPPVAGFVRPSDVASTSLALAAWIIGGYAVSLFWTMATGLYLLLRQSLDGAELDAVYLEDDQPRHGLPPIAADERGVPVNLPDEAPPTAPRASPETSPG